MWEDYRSPLFEVHWWAVMGVAFFALYAAVPLWILTVAVRRFRSSRRVHVTQAGLYLVGWGLIATFITLDPYRFITWFAD
jgi:hypothetical protein